LGVYKIRHFLNGPQFFRRQGVHRFCFFRKTRIIISGRIYLFPGECVYPYTAAFLGLIYQVGRNLFAIDPVFVYKLDSDFFGVGFLRRFHAYYALGSWKYCFAVPIASVAFDLSGVLVDLDAYGVAIEGNATGHPVV